MNTELEIIAFIASAMAVCGSLPQIFKIMRTKDTKALSATTYSMITLSCMMWIIYGLTAPTYSIILWNSILMLLCILILSLKLRYEHPEIWCTITNLSYKHIPLKVLSALIILCAVSGAALAFPMSF